MKQSGFTLIELLIVIAILGILSATALSSLSTARLKAADAAVQQTVTNMRAEAELYFGDNGDYLGMCEDTHISEALAEADSRNGTGSVICVDGDNVSGAWAMEAQLVASTTTYYCVDNDGEAAEYNSSTIDDTSGSEDAACG